MSKESTPVFEPHAPQPEQRQPDILNALKNSEVRRGEKLSSLTEQAKSLNALKMNGFREEITKENFPDVQEKYLEEARFFADTTLAGFYMQDAKFAKDPVLQKMLEQKAHALMAERDKRMKEYLEKTDGKQSPPPTVDIPKAKVLPQKKVDDHLYL